MKSKLNIAKKVIHENIEMVPCGVINGYGCDELARLRMKNDDIIKTVYDDDGLKIEIGGTYYCQAYFVVYGLSDKEFNKLQIHYYEESDIFG